MMRVITGLAKGRRLVTLNGTDVIRPTTESVKEALFSMIQFEIAGSEILDLFSGCGQLGIEALSRGASKCTFVDSDKNAISIVKQNLAKCKLEQSSDVVCSDARTFLNRAGKYDIVLLDPPYNKNLIVDIFPLVVKSMKSGGIIVCETQNDEALPQNLDNWEISKERRHGKTKLTLYREVEI